MSDYTEGSTTAEYRRCVDNATEICENQKNCHKRQETRLPIDTFHKYIKTQNKRLVYCVLKCYNTTISYFLIQSARPRINIPRQMLYESRKSIIAPIVNKSNYYFI